MKKLLILIIAVAGIYFFAKHYAGPDETTVEIARNMKSNIDKADRVALEVNLREVKSSVQSFRGSEGRLPDSLQELVDKGYIGRVLEGISYDSESGKVDYKF